jgi:hypothetical protein
VSRSGDEFGDAVKEHSGWLVPLAVFFATACLSALVLAYYFAPGPSRLALRLPSPTDSPMRVSLSLGAVTLSIPANYLPMADTRRGGAEQEIDLAAVLPRLDGFSLGALDAFNANAPDSPILHATLKAGPPPLPEKERLHRIYLPLVEDEYGQDGPFGLRRYSFRADTGYHNQDLFYASGESGSAAIICDKQDANTPSPNCLRNYALGNGLVLSYRFKRTQLEHWQKIDSDLRALLAKFEERT